MLNRDYKELLQAFAAEKVRCLLVGAYAMAAHGYLRATTDIDIWVMPSADNAQAVLRALKRFGAALQGLTDSDLQRDDTVFQIGVSPRRVDIITGATGLRFEEAFSHSVEVAIEGMPLRVLSLDDLIRNKRASGRAQDLIDAEALEALRASEASDSQDSR